MSRRLLVVITGIAVCLGIGSVAFSAASHDRPRVQQREEVLLGSYSCSAGLADASLFVQLEATGDVLNDETFIFTQVPVLSTPTETCEPRALAALESLAADCTASDVAVVADDTSESRSFQFVCRAGRPSIIRTIADLSAALFARAP